MRISQKRQYALQTLMVLTQRYEQRATQIRQIAHYEALPQKFLELILLELKRVRLVDNVRGAKGGYPLKRSTAEILRSQVIRTIDGPLAPFGDAQPLRDLIASDNAHRLLFQVFLDARDAAAQILEKTSQAGIVGPVAPQQNKAWRESAGGNSQLANGLILAALERQLEQTWGSERADRVSSQPEGTFTHDGHRGSRACPGMEKIIKRKGWYLMKPIKHLFLAALMLAALTADAWAQTETAAKPAPEKNSAAALGQPVVTLADIQALKDGLAAAQRQIQALQDELHRRDQAVHQDQTTAAESATKPGAAQLQASQEQQTAGALESDAANLETPSSSAPNNAASKDAVLTLQETTQSSNSAPEQVFNKEMEGPLTIRFKGINVTPGGFAEAAFVRRSRALGADLTTPFNSLTMPGASQSQLSEFFGSARQSRPTVFVEGRLGNVDLSSYVSGDFLSAGVTSTATQTNSYTFRLRQVWGQARFDNGWSFLGGQMWSLVTENKAGIAPSDDTGKTNDARPMTIDPGYHVGFSFARQYGIRLTKSFGHKIWLAVAMENPQATLTTHGNSNNFLLGELGASNSYNNTAGYSFNPSPDVIAKIAFDPGVGHYELFGLVDRFTDRIFPCVEFVSTSIPCTAAGATAATGAYNASKEGGGFGANARWNFAHKRMVFGLHGFGGRGVGRYGAGQLSDLSINADGSIHLIKNLQGLGTLEWHGKKLDIYAYGGAEYAARTWDFDRIQNNGKGADVGYGAPGFNNTGCYTETAPGSTTVGFTPGSLNHCIGDTRALIEGTLGFWYRFYAGPRGRFQFGTQYSYVTRNTWSGTGGLPAGSGGLQPNGLDGMVFTSFRYYLP